MTQLIAVSRGIHGTRVLAGAYATVVLRKRGELPKLRDPIHTGRRGRPWSDAEFDQAHAARLRGQTIDMIAKFLGRSTQAVSVKLREVA